jgi:murein L,D-transpeptidase YafK
LASAEGLAVFDSRARRVTALLFAVVLSGQVLASTGDKSKDAAPIPISTLALMAARNTTAASPILIRSFKKEAELEVWKQTANGRFVHLKTFPICRWSGQLGPKLKEGDRQTPEGFYSVTPQQLNPNSAYHLSFDIGFPNAYDKAQGASGSHLMVHGACTSAGCYAMTDQAVEEIYAIVREAFAGGQKAFQFQALPFRMTAQNMVAYRSDPHIAFWRQLKEGSDRFEATGEEPTVSVSEKRYVFAPSKRPEREARAVARRSEEEARMASLTEAGTTAAVRTTYVDGGQHRSFAALIRQGASVGLLSRPDALAFAPREIVVTPARAVRHVAEVVSERQSGSQLSVFGRQLLGYGPAQLIYNRPLVPGSMEILLTVLMASSFAVAVQH